MTISIFQCVVLALMIVTNIILGMLVIMRNPRRKTNIYFFLLVASIVTWMISNFFVDEPIRDSLVIFFGKLDFASAILAFTFFFLFARSFTDSKDNVIRIKEAILILFGLALFILTFFTNLIVERVDVISLGISDVVPGKFEIIYNLYIVFLLIWSSIILFKGLKKSKGLKRAQILYILAGLSITLFIAVTVNIFVPLIITNLEILKYFTRFGLFSFFIFIFATSYAILRYRLMDIRVVLKKSTVFTFSLFLITASYIFLIILAGLLFNFTISIVHTVLIGFIISFFITIAYEPMKISFEKLSNQLFFREKIDYQSIINDLSDLMSEKVVLDDLIHSLIINLCEKLKLRGASLLIFDEKRKCFLPFLGDDENFLIKEDVCLSYKNALVRYFIKNKNSVLILEELRRRLAEENLTSKKIYRVKKEIKELEKLNTFLCMSVYYDSNINYILCVGDKLSGDPFFDEDLAILRIIANQGGVAIKNAKLYSILEKKIKELEKINRLMIGREVKMAELKKDLRKH